MTQYKLSFLHPKKPVTRAGTSYTGSITSTTYKSMNYKTKNPSLYSYIVFVFKDSYGTIIDVSDKLKNITVKADPANKPPAFLNTVSTIDEVYIDPSSTEDPGFFCDKINGTSCLVYRSHPQDTHDNIVSNASVAYLTKTYSSSYVKCIFGDSNINFAKCTLERIIVYDTFKPLKFTRFSSELFN